jgi:hypothetical protein
MLEQILEYRAFAAAWGANAVDPRSAQASPMRRLAQEIEWAIAGEEIAEKEAAARGQ